MLQLISRLETAPFATISTEELVVLKKLLYIHPPTVAVRLNEDANVHFASGNIIKGELLQAIACDIRTLR